MRKYKLIKKLPFENSPKIGYIPTPHTSHNSQDGEIYYWSGVWFHPKDYPDYWEEIVEKDYEILSLISTRVDKTIITYKNGGGTYNSNLFPVVYKSVDYWVKCFTMNNNPWQIHSVKRLSDGEVFTVGDLCNPIGKCSYNIGTIDKIEFCKVGYLRLASKNWYMNIDGIEHSKKPLFTTEDGVDIYKGDIAVPIDPKTFKIFASTNYNTGESIKFGSYLYFSTKEAALEWIVKNEKSLSINDITSHFKVHPDKDTFTVSKEELTKLVKSKL